MPRQQFQGSVETPTPEQRLSKIRSIIKNFERQVDRNPDIDQIPILREAIAQISMALGPQTRGKRRQK